VRPVSSSPVYAARTGWKPVVLALIVSEPSLGAVQEYQTELRVWS
jgi:hypothetical protein